MRATGPAGWCSMSSPGRGRRKGGRSPIPCSAIRLEPNSSTASPPSCRPKHDASSSRMREATCFPVSRSTRPTGCERSIRGPRALRRYLEQPLTIYLGQGDTRDDERNDYPEALAQGASRYQRGLKVFNAAKTLAQARGWTFNWRLVELPGVGHSARKMFSAPQALEALSP